MVGGADQRLDKGSWSGWRCRLEAHITGLDHGVIQVVDGLWKPQGTGALSKLLRCHVVVINVKFEIIYCSLLLLLEADLPPSSSSVKANCGSMVALKRTMTSP